MRQDEDGFTLVEMLVALAIFGMLASAGVMVMRSTFESQAMVKARVDRLGDFQRLRAILRADLGQAALRSTRDPDGIRQTAAFRGDDRSADGAMLSLVRRGWENPDAQARASLQYVEYRVDQGRLERRVRPALDGAALGAPQVLFDGVEAAHIAFFAKQQWSSAWAQTGVLPQAVRLDLTLKGLGSVTQLFLTPGSAG